MKNRVYINGSCAISAQPTFEGDFLDNINENVQDNVLPVIEPNYRDYIAPSAIRRMSRAVKMGIVASKRALGEACLEIPEAIAVGTGMGCVQDSEKFLRAVLDNEEQYLTPTAFIQSTHNTVAGQIALELQCKGANFTFVDGSTSFESALSDAAMQIELGDIRNALVGGVDENTPYCLEIYELDNIIKPRHEAPFSITDARSKGVVFSEGASFFVLSDERNEHTYAALADVDFRNDVPDTDLFIGDFLSRNNLDIDDIDLMLSGRNGNSEDLAGFDTAEKLMRCTKLYYKHLSGDYFTASAFGFWVACNVLRSGRIPQLLKPVGTPPEEVRNMLIYNQFRGKGQSLILLQKV